MIFDVNQELIDVFNTSETYNKLFYIYKNNLICPYINLQITENEKISGLNRYDKLDYCYLVFKDIKSITWNCIVNNTMNEGKKIFLTTKKHTHFTDYINGYNMDDVIEECEFEINYNEEYFYFSNNFNVKNNPLDIWRPLDIGKIKKNMADDKVQNFFKKKHIPKEILDLIGAKEKDIQTFKMGYYMD